MIDSEDLRDTLPPSIDSRPAQIEDTIRGIVRDEVKAVSTRLTIFAVALLGAVGVVGYLQVSGIEDLRRDLSATRRDLEQRIEAIELRVQALEGNKP